MCNHAGGPLADGRIDGDYVTCPWHNWKYHARTGLGEPGYEEDACPAYQVKVEDERLLVDLESATKRSRKPHSPHPLARRVTRELGPIRVAGISGPRALSVVWQEPVSSGQALFGRAPKQVSAVGPTVAVVP